MSQPHFGQVWGWNSHFHSWGFGVLRDSRRFRAWLQGSKHLTFGCLGVIGKILKCRCPKWPRMSHLDICSPSYGQKKDREFDSRPLKVRNQPNPDVCWANATWRLKGLEESYKIGSDLVPIGGWGEKLWCPKVPGVQTGIVSRLHIGSPGTKSHSDVDATGECREYYMGDGGGIP